MELYCCHDVVVPVQGMPLEALPEEIEQKIPGVFSMISYIVPPIIIFGTKKHTG
jgi:hypothetical protein